MPLTLEDIARISGVSRSTVSRVINCDSKVNEETRHKVLEVIQNTGYQPHAAARSLASQRSFTIGLILPQSVGFFFADPYLPRLVQGIAQGCNQHEYILALFLAGTKEEEQTLFPRVAHTGLLDGVVVQVGHHGDQWIVGQMVDAGLPMVVAGRPFRSDNVTYIDIDNVYAAENAINHLILLGRKRIATITGPLTSTAGIDRLEGYRRALAQRGRKYDEGLVVEGDFTENSGYVGMQRLLGAKPDAVFAASDIMAVGAMRAIEQAGLRVPEDIAMVGFDDLLQSATEDTQLTTIRQDVVQFGTQAAELLIDQVEHGRQPPRHIIMGTDLIIRKTCGARSR